MVDGGHRGYVLLCPKYEHSPGMRPEFVKPYILRAATPKDVLVTISSGEQI